VKSERRMKPQLHYTDYRLNREGYKAHLHPTNYANSRQELGLVIEHYFETINLVE
jgi:hypothetical protein